MINEMSWQQFSTLPGMNTVPLHEIERQYRIYLNEIAEQRIAIHLIQEAARSQAEAMAVAASNGGGSYVVQEEQEEEGLPSGSIEFIYNTTDGTNAEFDVTTSGPTNYTITWGDGAEDAGEIDGGVTIEHEYADSDTEYTVRICFDNVSLVTELAF